MMFTVEHYHSIGRYLNIYLGSLMLLAGLFGASMNLWLFTRHRFRKSPCSRYIIVSSLFDILHLIVALFFRVLADGLGIDPASSTLFTCRIRYYLITFSAYTSIGCRCLAAFDRYACTSRSIAFRQLSSFRMAYRFLLMNVIFWAGFSVPNLFFFTLIPTKSRRMTCYVLNRIYSNYFAYFVNPVLYFALPLVILISSAMLTQRNLRLMGKTRRIRKLERQMTSMIVLQAIMNSMSSVPYGVHFLYAAVTLNSTKDQHRLAQEHFFLQLTRLNYYINFISSFYIYLYSSQHIRSTIRRVFRKRRVVKVREKTILSIGLEHHLSENCTMMKTSNAKSSSINDEDDCDFVRIHLNSVQ